MTTEEKKYKIYIKDNDNNYIHKSNWADNNLNDLKSRCIFLPYVADVQTFYIINNEDECILTAEYNKNLDKLDWEESKYKW